MSAKRNIQETTQTLKKARSYQEASEYSVKKTGKSVAEHEHDYMKKNWDFELSFELVEKIESELSVIDVENEIQTEMLRAAEAFLKSKYNQVPMINPWKEAITNNIIVTSNIEESCLTVRMHQLFPESKAYSYDQVVNYLDKMESEARKSVRHFFTSV